MDETVALGTAVLIGGDLAGQDVTECGKGVVEGLNHGSICVKSLLWGSETSLSDLVVDLLVEVLNEDVALTSLAQRGVTLRPHDTARIAYKHRMDSAMTAPQNLPGTAFDQRVVELFEGALACIGSELTWNGKIMV